MAAKSSKSNLVLRLSARTLEEITRDAKLHGVSTNAEIESIFRMYSLFIRNLEALDSIAPIARIFSYFVSIMDEDELVDLFREYMMVTVLLTFKYNNIPMTTQNLVEDGFSSLILWSGLYHTFNYHKDKEYYFMTFNHQHGGKWSNVLGKVFGHFMKAELGCETAVSTSPSAAFLKVKIE